MVISTTELKHMIDNEGDYVLIDVRREDELHHGMIPTAKHLCLDEVESAFEMGEEEFLVKYGFLRPSKDELIIVHCRTGGRSNVAASYLKGKGFNVENYEGSVQEWSRIDENVKMY
jgi:rhodanese-related sulfurtransferase